MDDELFLNEEVPLTRVRALLVDVFGGDRFADPYVEWLYRSNPVGPEIAVNVVRDGACLAHYGMIPQWWGDEGAPLLMGLSLNTSVSEALRGKGVFMRMAGMAYERATGRGVAAVLGVANANATHGRLKYMDFRLVGSLPVRVGVAAPWSPPGVAEVGPEDLPETLFERGGGGGWRQAWTRESLGWRLASPLTTFRLHLHDSGAMVTCRTTQGGLPFVVVAKILPMPGHRVAVGRLLAAAAKSHGTPAYVYAGYNGAARVGGIPLPRRILPSPLNLIYRRLADSAPAEFRPGCFEFLDFDAY